MSMERSWTIRAEKNTNPHVRIMSRAIYSHGLAQICLRRGIAGSWDGLGHEYLIKRGPKLCIQGTVEVDRGTSSAKRVALWIDVLWQI